MLLMDKKNKKIIADYGDMILSEQTEINKEILCFVGKEFFLEFEDNIIVVELDKSDKKYVERIIDKVKINKDNGIYKIPISIIA